jgi:SP family general alpha glucoside:H+ symporter-like MFS transporter
MNMDETFEKQAVAVEMTAASQQLLDNAEAAMAWEHALTPRRAAKLYSRAILYGAIVSLMLIMEGFDTKIMGSLYAVPAFEKAYGSRQRDGTYQISAAWQSGMSGITGTTQMLGMFLGGYVTERFGFRKTMLATMISMPPIVFAFFFAPNIQVLAVANFLFCKSPYDISRLYVGVVQGYINIL